MLSKIDKSYSCSDDVIHGNPCFRYDFMVGFQKMSIYLESK